MAFGTGAVTATLIGAGVGGAIGIGGNFLMSSLNKGSGIDSASIKSTLDQYLSQISSAVQTGRANIASAVKGMDKKIGKYTGELRDASDAETKAFWNNLGIFNDSLINSASALVNEYNGDVNKALETLQTNVGKLNEGYAADMGKEIERYGSVEDAINAQLASDKNVSETKFLERVNQNKTEYEQKSLSEIDAAKAEQMSLGDTFMERSNAALGKFDKFISPENMTASLDALSKNIQKTRLDLIATADPRAAELSAIADENAAALMSGRISSDVQANLARSGAMRALQGGFGADSGMGRNLQARDLGLTSLDLMGKGYDMFDRQRRLNYDTKVAGIQDSATNAFGEMRAGQSELLRNTLSTAESDRNQRVGAVQEASGQRLQTFDRLFGANMGVADTLRAQDMNTAAQLSQQRRDANIRATGMRTATTQDIYNNMMGLSDTVFNAQLGLGGQKLSTGLSVAGDIYKTNVGGAGKTYDTRLNLENNIFGTRSQAAIEAMRAAAMYEASALDATAGALGDVAATKSNIPILQAGQRQAGANASAQMWGSALQAGSSLAGSFLGNANWNSSARGYGGGYRNPVGYSNFDMGSGTGA